MCRCIAIHLSSLHFYSKFPYIPHPELTYNMNRRYLICLTIGPAFLTAAIYLCLARIVVIYGEGVSRVKPRTYTVVFISCDFLSLLLQAAGGALASVANTPAQDQTGINIMVAGLSWQVFSLVLFIALCAEYAWRVSRSAIGPDTGHASTRSTFKFQAFLWSLGVATLAILIRSAFRVAELSQGFHGKLANQQVTFMILEGAMVVSACILLTVFHPGLAFGGAWSAATWTLRTREAQKVDKTPKASAGWRPMSMFRRISGGNEKFVGEHVKGVSEKEDGSIRGSAC